jgi:putative AdoMet-dependent methyltransferase
MIGEKNMEQDQYPASEFDEWAPRYDEIVTSGPAFPFDGYQSVLEKTFAQAHVQPGMSVLDLGTGTGNLALLFERAGCQLWCTDYSLEMLVRARAKLPNANFTLNDLRGEWPDALERRFDRIVSAYVFHHFPLDQKVALLVDLSNKRLLPGGWMVIADISFENAASLEAVKNTVGSEWDDEEYWLADESLQALELAGLEATYQQISSCAGVYVIQPVQRD